MPHPGGRSRDAHGGVALALDEPAQGRGVYQAAVEAVEGVEDARGAAPTGARAGLGDQRLGDADQHIADQLLAGSEPAVDRRAAEPDVAGDRLDIERPRPRVPGLHAGIHPGGPSASLAARAC
jgi:hypothetical protein